MRVLMIVGMVLGLVAFSFSMCLGDMDRAWRCLVLLFLMLNNTEIGMIRERLES